MKGKRHKRRTLGKGDFFLDYRIKNHYGSTIMKGREMDFRKAMIELNFLKKKKMGLE